MKAPLRPLAVLAAAATLLGGMMLPTVANAAEDKTPASDLGLTKLALQNVQRINKLRASHRTPLSAEQIAEASTEDSDVMYGKHREFQPSAFVSAADDGNPLPPLRINVDMMKWAQHRADMLLDNWPSDDPHKDVASGRPSWVPEYFDVGSDPRYKGGLIYGPEALVGPGANMYYDGESAWAAEALPGQSGYSRQGYGHYLTLVSRFADIAGYGIACNGHGDNSICVQALEVTDNASVKQPSVSVEDALADVDRQIAAQPEHTYATATVNRRLILHLANGSWMEDTQEATVYRRGRSEADAKWTDAEFPAYTPRHIDGQHPDRSVVPAASVPVTDPAVDVEVTINYSKDKPSEPDKDDPHKGDAGEDKPGRPDGPRKGDDKPAKPAKPTESPARRADRMAAQYRDVLEDGTWAMRSVFGARVLDVAGGNRDNGGNIQIYDGNGTPAQEWTVTHDSKGYVSLRNRGSGRMLDLVGGAARRGQNIDQYEANGTRAQKWIATHSPTGIVLRSAVDPDYAVDIAGGADRNGVNVRLWDANGSRAQSWAAALTPRAQARKWAADSRHEAVDGTWVMRSGINTVIDVAGGSRDNGANVQSYEANRTGAQEWVLSHDGDGFITIRNRVSGRVLDVAGGHVGNGTNIRQWDANGSLAQKWVAMRGNGGFSLRSALDPYYAVDIAGGSHADGTNIRLWECNGSGAQAWVLKPTPRGEADRLAAASGDVLKDGTYTVRSNVGNRMVLDVAGGSRANWADVRLWQGNGTRAQKWTVSHDRQGYVTLRNGSGRMLDAAGGVGRDGTNIDQYQGNGTRAQKWVAVKHGGAIVLHSAIDPLLVVDVAGGGNRNGTEVRLWKGNDSRAQDWMFAR